MRRSAFRNAEGVPSLSREVLREKHDPADVIRGVRDGPVQGFDKEKPFTADLPPSRQVLGAERRQILKSPD
jgi:hypothetical protein